MAGNLILRSSTYTDPVVANPAWLDLMTVGTWARIGGASPSHSLPAAAVGKRTLQDVVEASILAGSPSNVYGQSGPDDIINNYGAAIFASGYGNQGGYSPWNGGHNDYHGNAVYMFNLETREWLRLNNNYTGVSWPRPSGVWADNSPGIPHTLNCLQYVPRLNALMTAQLNVTNIGTSAPKCGFFNLTTLQWSYGSECPVNFPDNSSFGVYDTENDCVWTEGGAGNSAFAKYTLGASDGSGGTWTTFNTVNEATQDAVAAIAPSGTLHATKPILVCTKFHNSTEIRAVDLTAPASGATILTQSGRPSVTSRHTWDWSDALQAFIYWKDGSNNVYKVTKGSGTFSAATYTWTNILNSGSNTVSPNSFVGDGGLYQKVRLCKWGTKEALVGVVSNISDPVYAFRIS